MTGLALWDAVESRNAAERGIELAANNRAALLTEARELAKVIARQKGEVSADDVVFALCERGYGVHCLGPAAGSLFTGREWQWTGRFTKSTRIHARANLLRLWRLK